MDNNRKKISKAIEMFETKPLWKSMLYVISLSVLAGLLQGVYIFTDQVLMVNLIPQNSNFNNLAIYGQANVSELISSSSIIRKVNSISAPFILIAAALSLGFGLGTSINYSRALGSGNYENAKEVWRSGFYSTFFFGILSSFFLMIVAYYIIPTQLGNISDPTIPDSFKEIYRKTTLEYARNFMLIIVGANVFQSLMQLLSTCLNSEGRNFFTTIILLFVTFVNIGLDVVLLKYTNLGVLGSSTATLISWVFGVVGLLAFIYHLNKKDSTLLQFSILKKVKIELTILWLIIGIGGVSFLRNISSAILVILNNNEIIHVTENIGIYQDSSYFTGINGAVVPIYNLLFSGLVGIVRGGRTVLGYVYSAGRFRDVKKVFFMSILISIGTAVVLYVFGVFALGKPLLRLFDMDRNIAIDGDSLWTDSILALRINSSGLITFSIAIGGTMFFQSIGDIKRSNLMAVTQAIIFGIPIIYINSAISTTIGGNIGTWLYYSSQIISFGISSVFIIVYSIWYVINKLPNDIVIKNR